MSHRASKAPLILAIDQGTTSTKAAVVDRGLRILAEASSEFPQHFPRPGWVEHDPEEIYSSVRRAVQGVLRKARLPASRITALGVANQRETTIVWERATGRPVHRAIVWQDRRTQDICARLRKEGAEGQFREATGLVLDPYFSGTKIAWILQNVAGARRLAQGGKLLFGTVDTYLAWRLTAGASHVTDVSNASRTLLMDLASGAWRKDLMDALEIPGSLLPEIRDNDSIFGRTRGVGWLPDGIPIASVVGDQQSALLGQACVSPGTAKCTYGTGAFLVAHTGGRIVRSRHGLLSTAAWRRGGKMLYGLEGSTFVAGAVVQWLRDGLGIIGSSSEVEALAKRVDDSGGVVFVPALTGLGAPHWSPAARGLICGLSRGATAAHLARAALEGIAFQVRDLVVAAEKDMRFPLKALRADGGATANALLMQFQADILGVPVVIPRFTSTTALGAAALAGLTMGLFSSEVEISRHWKCERRFEPRMGPDERSRRLELWQEALRRVKL